MEFGLGVAGDDGALVAGTWDGAGKHSNPSWAIFPIAIAGLMMHRFLDQELFNMIRPHSERRSYIVLLRHTW